MNIDQLTLIISAIDRASPVFRAVERSMGALASGSRSLLGHFVSLGRGALDLARHLLGSLLSALERVAAAAVRVGAVLGGALLAGMVAVGKAGVSMNVTLERATLSLTKITGSAEGAARLLGRLRQESLTSALTFKEMIPIAQQLAAAYGPGGIGRVIPTMRAFGDATALLGVDAPGQRRALLGFRQIISQENPSQEELKQVSENLPGLDVPGILRRKLGSADSETLRDAKISGKQIGEAIVAGMQDTFGGAQAAMAGTLPLILSNFGDAWNNLTSAIVARFTPALTAALGKVLAVVQGLAGNERLVTALAVPFDLLAVAIGKAADALPSFVEWLSQVLTKENVVGLLSDIGGWILTIGQRIGQLIETATNGGGLTGLWEAFQAAAKTAVDFVLRGINALAAGLSYLGQHSGEIWAVFESGVNAAGAAIDTLIGAVVVLGSVIVSSKILEVIGALGGLVGAAGGGVRRSSSMQAGMMGGGGGSWDAPTGGSAAAGGGGFRGWGEPPSAERQREIFGEPPKGLWDGIKRSLFDEFVGGPLADLRQKAIGGAQQAYQWAISGGGLRNIGAGARGAAGGFLSANIPQNIQDFAGGLAGAVRGGWQSGGLDSLLSQQGGNAGVVRGVLNRLLGGGSAPGDPNAPRTMLYGQGGGGGGAAVPELPDKKQLKAIEAAREAYYRMLGAQGKAAGALLGSDEATAAERAWLDVETQIPALEAKQQSLTQRMQDLAESAKTSAVDAKEYYDSASEWAQAEEQKADLRTRAQDADKRATEKAGRETKKAADDARSVMSKRIELALATVESNPFLSKTQRGTASANVMLEQFRLLNTPQAGETEEDALDRQIKAQGVRGDIFKSLGLGMKSVGLLGGGSLDVGNRQRMSEVSGILDRTAGQAANVSVAVVAPPPADNYWQQMVNQPGFAAALQQFLAGWAYQQSQQASPGVSY